MNTPDNYIGKTVVIQNRKGHEDRTSKFLYFHDDK